jgi:hypothetical protein
MDVTKTPTNYANKRVKPAAAGAPAFGASPTNYANKRVKPVAAGTPAFGAGPKTAAGSKRVKPGDKNTTSAKFVRPLK